MIESDLKYFSTMRPGTFQKQILVSKYLKCSQWALPRQHLQSFTKTTCMHFWIITGLRVVHIFYCRYSLHQSSMLILRANLTGDQRRYLLITDIMFPILASFFFLLFSWFSTISLPEDIGDTAGQYTLSWVTNVVSYNISKICILLFLDAEVILLNYSHHLKKMTLFKKAFIFWRLNTLGN